MKKSSENNEFKPIKVKIWDQLWNLTYIMVWTQGDDQVWSFTSDQIHDKVKDRVNTSTWSQLYWKIIDIVNERI